MKKILISIAVVAILAGCAHQVPVKSDPVVAIPEQKFMSSMKK